MLRDIVKKESTCAPQNIQKPVAKFSNVRSHIIVELEISAFATIEVS
jgi:hypothetical protein